MNNMELLYAKREIEGFEVLEALCVAETMVDVDKDIDIKTWTMRILFDDKYSKSLKLKVEQQKEKLDPLLKIFKHIMDKKQES